MRIEYKATPAHLLPLGVQALVIEGEHNIVIQMSEDASTQDLAEALTQAVNAHAKRSWIHVREGADWEALKLA
jgi:hypothetical protein